MGLRSKFLGVALLGLASAAPAWADTLTLNNVQVGAFSANFSVSFQGTCATCAIAQDPGKLGFVLSGVPTELTFTNPGVAAALFGPGSTPIGIPSATFSIGAGSAGVQDLYAGSFGLGAGNPLSSTVAFSPAPTTDRFQADLASVGTFTYDINPNDVPEPASAGLIVLGLAGLAALRRRPNAA